MFLSNCKVREAFTDRVEFKFEQRLKEHGEYLIYQQILDARLDDTVLGRLMSRP